MIKRAISVLTIGLLTIGVLIASGCNSSSSDSGSNVGSATNYCPTLAATTGNIVNVSNVTELTTAVTNALPGDAILLADGNYQLDNTGLILDVANLELRSASGNRDAVILDSNYLGGTIITIAANDVTVADLTIRESYTHPIHVMSTASADTTGTLIYNVHIIDPRQQAIKITPGGAGTYADNGVIACSTIELTDTGRPSVDPSGGGCNTGGISATGAQNWGIRDNTIQGFWCDTGLAEHAIHSWVGSRDTVVERNELIDNARGIGFGLANSGTARTYTDNPCAGVTGYIGHYGGVVRNNFIFTSNASLFSSAAGSDCGICFWSACSATAVHNSVVSTDASSSSIEWRYTTSSGVEVTNNIATHSLLARDSATATLTTNIENASLGLFVDGANGNLHLDPGATSAIDQGTNLTAGLCTDDIDGDVRDANPDIGADEI